jgi:hypothetical protein
MHKVHGLEEVGLTPDQLLLTELDRDTVTDRHFSPELTDFAVVVVLGDALAATR